MDTIVVQKAVILNQQQILMLRRSETDVRRPLQWDLPGGMREAGEELIASIKREVVEETGLAIDELSPVFAKTEIRNWKDEKGEHINNVVFIFYLARTNNKEIKVSHEHKEFKWENMEQAVKEFEYPLHIEALKHLLNVKIS